MSALQSLQRRGIVALALAAFAFRNARAQTPGAVLLGNNELSSFASRLENVGDVDGDRVDDLLVSERGFAHPGESTRGRACLYSGATMTLIRTHEGDAENDGFGETVHGAGDVDLDGVPDYIVGSEFVQHAGIHWAGEVAVFSGRTGDLLWVRYGTEANAGFGTSAAGIGDVDGDGRSDVLVGTPHDDRVTLFDAFGNVLMTLQGKNQSLFGEAIAPTADLDGDGVTDFFVSAPTANVHGTSFLAKAGCVVAMSRATMKPIYCVCGDNAKDSLGTAIATLGDLDHDGVPDLIAGAQFGRHDGLVTGLVCIASGRTGKKLATIYGEPGSEHFGSAVAGLGDWNGDGAPDFAVGAFAFTEPGTISAVGKARIYSGKNGSVLQEWIGVDQGFTGNESLGISIAGGDFNHDGIADIVLGDDSYRHDNGDGTNTFSGAAFEYFGDPTH